MVKTQYLVLWYENISRNCENNFSFNKRYAILTSNSVHLYAFLSESNYLHQ